MHPGITTRLLRVDADCRHQPALRQPEVVVSAFGGGAHSAIPNATLAAYLETHFCVEGSEPFVLCLGEANRTLAALHARHGVTASAFVTACNPCSASLDDRENARRQAALRDDLERRNLSFLGGAGRHPDNGWPPEASFLVLGLELDEARALGDHWQQNAVVWAGADAVPRLLLLR